MRCTISIGNWLEVVAMRKARLVLVVFSVACGGETVDDRAGQNGGTSGTSSGGTAAASSGGTAATSTGGTAATSTGGTAATSTGGVGALGGSSSFAGSGGGGSGGIPPDVGSGQCPDFTPCGGSLTGVWNYTACTDPLPGLRLQSLYCNGVNETLTVFGVIDIRADGTLTGTATLRSQAVLPATCSCGLPPGYLFECTLGPDRTCTCDSTDNEPDNATYVTNGNVVIGTNDNGTEYAYYCRQGAEVWMRDVDEQGVINVHHLTPR
jgi:hypothetical protein